MNTLILISTLILNLSLGYAAENSRPNLLQKCLKEQENLIQDNHEKQKTIERLFKSVCTTTEVKPNIITREDVIEHEALLNYQIEEYFGKNQTAIELYVPYEVHNNTRVIGIDSCGLDHEGKPSNKPWSKPATLFQITEKGAEELKYEGTKKATYPLNCDGPIERSLWLYKAKYIPAAIPLLTTSPNIKYFPIPKDAFKEYVLTDYDKQQISAKNLIYKMYPVMDKSCQSKRWEKVITIYCENSSSIFINHRRILNQGDPNNAAFLEVIATLEIDKRIYYFVAYTSNQGIDMNADNAFELVTEFGEPIRPKTCSLPQTC